MAQPPKYFGQKNTESPTKWEAIHHQNINSSKCPEPGKKTLNQQRTEFFFRAKLLNPENVLNQPPYPIHQFQSPEPKCHR